jgi:hypothetical protein
MPDDYKMPLPRLIHRYSDWSAILLGLLFNIKLLIIIKRNNKKELESFGQIVFMNCILDLYLGNLKILIFLT